MCRVWSAKCSRIYCTFSRRERLNFSLLVARWCACLILVVVLAHAASQAPSLASFASPPKHCCHLCLPLPVQWMHGWVRFAVLTSRPQTRRRPAQWISTPSPPKLHEFSHVDFSCAPSSVISCSVDVSEELLAIVPCKNGIHPVDFVPQIAAKL